MTWKDWTQKHATIFGLTDARDGAMLAEWARLFQQSGFTPAELLAATEWVAAHDAPRFRNQHLSCLTNRVRAERARQETARIRHPAGDYCCRLCSDTGTVSGLPALRPNICFPHAWYTERAFCRCPIGRGMAARQPGLLTIDDYERSNPGWREQVAAHEAEAIAHGAARRTAEGLDRALGEVLSKARGKG